MKNLLTYSFVLLFAIVGKSQIADSIRHYVGAGVKLHDEGKYHEAIKMYDRALKLDPNNLLSLAEKGMSQFYIKDYAGSVKSCEKAIAIDPLSKNLRMVYTVIGNSYDAMGKPEESLKAYEKGITSFPHYFQLYYNKGITLIGLKRSKDALESFWGAIKANPDHGSSHNAIARVEFDNNQKIISLLALSRFLIVEPETKRSSQNFQLMNEILTGGIEKTGRKSMTINLNIPGLGDTTKKANDFTTSELIFGLGAALDADKKKMKETEKFENRMSTLFASLGETQKDNFGFYWEYYVPYFVELKKKGHMEAFSYITHATLDEKYIVKWFKKNPDKIKAFYEWSNNYKWPTVEKDE